MEVKITLTRYVNVKEGITVEELLERAFPNSDAKLKCAIVNCNVAAKSQVVKDRDVIHVGPMPISGSGPQPELLFRGNTEGLRTPPQFEGCRTIIDNGFWQSSNKDTEYL